jgi:low affinity Fe/Cu permease
MNLDERFTSLAFKITDIAGRWQPAAIALGLFFLWLATGPFFGFSDTWQLIANTPTTWIELFLGLLTLTAANRVEESNRHLMEDVDKILLEVHDNVKAIQEMQHEQQTILQLVIANQVEELLEEKQIVEILGEESEILHLIENKDE